MDNAQLFAALREGDLATAEAYFRAHPEHVHVRNLQASDEDQSWNELTPMHMAAKYGHLNIIRLLVELGARVYSHPFCTYPAVIVASWSGHGEIVRYFLEEIPHRAEGTLGIGVTCNLAAREGWLAQVRQHLERDPLAVHQRGWIGDTPLHWPAHNGFLDIVDLLLAAGADPNIEENNWIGGTPLHWASERHADIIRTLVAHGAEVNARVTRPGSDHLGATPLIWCAKQRDDCAEAAQALLDLGADPALLDAEGKTARDYARPNVRALL